MDDCDVGLSAYQPGKLKGSICLSNATRSPLVSKSSANALESTTMLSERIMKSDLIYAKVA